MPIIVNKLQQHEEAGTNLFGRNLYPDVLGAAQSLISTNKHPFVFYQKLGYVVTGLVPDANGYGKPDILMCKRISFGDGKGRKPSATDAS